MPTKRYEISDYQWNQILHLFPVAKTGRPPKDNRMVFNAILWVARSDSAWRDLPERYGSWKTIYSRFCKWRDNGTLQRIFEALSADADYENLSIDSTLVRVHQHSAGAKKGRQGLWHCGNPGIHCLGRGNVHHTAQIKYIEPMGV